MSKCSFAIYKVMHGYIIPFLFALAFLQLPEANATCACESRYDFDECSSDRLKITGMLSVELFFLPRPPGIDIKVTSFVVLPCGVTRYGKPQHISLTNSGYSHFTLNPIQKSFPGSAGEYIAGVTISSFSRLYAMTFSLSHLVGSSLDEPLIVIPGSDRFLFDPLDVENIDFQLINSFIHPGYSH